MNAVWRPQTELIGQIFIGHQPLDTRLPDQDLTQPLYQLRGFLPVMRPDQRWIISMLCQHLLDASLP